MGRPQILHLNSVDELLAAGAAWDDLWWRSDVTRPAFRAEFLALWLEQFAPCKAFRALVVEDQGRWVAALPLVGRRIGRLIKAGALPSNSWLAAGELLLAPDSRVDVVLRALVSAMGKLPWPLLWLDGVSLSAARWHALLRALDRAGLRTYRRPRFEVGLIPIDHDWEACKRRWSKNHRRKMTKRLRQLTSQGDVRLEMQAQLPPQQVRPWIQRGFEVEDRSWKGEAGTSVLRAPGMFDLFVRQAELAAKWGQLELAFLELKGRPIAFRYGWNAKGIYHSCKVGYDAQYAAYSPGQLLMYSMLQKFHGGPERRAIDCMGPISDATSKWRPTRYIEGRVVVALGPIVGRAALGVYQHGWPLVRRLRDWSAVADVLPPDGQAPAGFSGH
jgi:CelD/BcsL family acetyltransferase involved in cellulose biosynthesis